MSYCPECRAEYREGVEVCSDCNVPLVDKLEEKVKPNMPQEFFQEEYLMTVNNSMDVALIESLLGEHSIPILKKKSGCEEVIGIYMGSEGITDIYVPKPVLAQARAITNGALLGVGVDVESETIIRDETEPKEYLESEDIGEDVLEVKDRPFSMKFIAIAIIAIAIGTWIYTRFL